MSLEVGVTVPNFGKLAHPDILVRCARRAEELGIDSVWVTDHVAMPAESNSIYPYSPDGRMTWPADEGWLDPLLALTWVAAHTNRIRLGTSVLVLPMRPALLVAKLAATLDQLSGGRLVLGVGAGWLAEEFALLGAKFEDRGPRMTEAIRLMRAAWTGQDVRFEGRFHSKSPFVMRPAPCGKHIPVLIGGHSNAALRRVADIGDGWLPTLRSPDQVAEGIATLDKHLSVAGRDRDDITVLARPGGQHALDGNLATAYGSAGVDGIIIDVPYDLQSGDAPEVALDRVAALR